jgi:D-3-phosphoglycerate dehydrogenase
LSTPAKANTSSAPEAKSSPAVPRILIADDVAPECRDTLARAGLQVTHLPRIAPEELLRTVGDFEGLIVRSRIQVTREVIEAGARLAVVGRAGIGTDNIDVEAATRRGIIVMNTPQANVTAAAEHTFSMLLGMARNLTRADAVMRAGGWDRSKFMGVELEGKVLGVVGLGKIGAQIVRFGRAFGMKPVAYDPFVTRERAEQMGVALDEFAELLERSDFISVHVPLTDKTRRLFSRAEFRKMKKSARIVNTSRGGVIDEEALVEALRNHEIAGAALDVFEQEPPPADSALRKTEGLVLTPHLGASTEEAQVKVAVEIAEQFAEYFREGHIRNAVNIAQVSDPSVRPFLDLARALGLLASQLASGRIGSIEATYGGEIARSDTRVVTAAAITGVLQPVAGEAVNLVNAAYYARERNIKVVETKLDGSTDYKNLLTVRVETDEAARSVSGTVFENREPRIVRVDSTPIDLRPAAHMMFMSYPDIPGVVGKFGTVLGRRQINIAHMAVGRAGRGKKAIIFVTVDDPIPEPVLEEIRQSIEGIETIRAIRL